MASWAGSYAAFSGVRRTVGAAVTVESEFHGLHSLHHGPISSIIAPPFDELGEIMANQRSGNSSSQPRLNVTKAWRHLLGSFIRDFGGHWTAFQLLVFSNIVISTIEKRRCTVQAIAEQEGLAQQTVSRCVKRLKDYGLVESLIDSNDERVRLLRLTQTVLHSRKRAYKGLMD